MVARLVRSRYARSVTILAGGTALAQLVTVVSAPVLARLFSPDEFGQLGLFLSVMYIGSLVVSLRYEQAVVVPTSTAAAVRLLHLALRIVPGVAIVVTIALFGLSATGVAGFGHLPTYAAVFALVGLVATGVLQALRFWLIRMQAYRIMSTVQVSQSLGRAAGQIALGFAGLGLVGLLIGDTLGRLVGLLRVIRAAGPGIAAAAREATPPMGEVIRGYWRFPILGVPSSLLNAAVVALPVPLLAMSYGLTIAGQFALVQRVLGLPLAVIGASVGDALLARLSEQSRDDPAAMRTNFLRTGLALTLITVPIAVVLAALGPRLFALVFGPAWTDAGRMASLLAPWFLGALIVSPLSRVAIIYQGQGWKLAYDILSMLGVVGSLLGGAAIGLGWPGAILAFALVQAAAYVVYFGILYRLVHTGASAEVARVS
jgi:O-antigen/teichoic acid export membrane protein